MEYDQDVVDEVVLALLYLNFHEDQDGLRAWKSFDWDAMNRLFAKGLISDPVNMSKSVLMIAEGESLAEELFAKYFGV
jgi:hypothetical protein